MKGMFPYVLNLAEAFQNKGSVKIPMADGSKIREVMEGATSEEINLWTEVVQNTTKETYHTFLVARPGQWVPLDAKYHGFARGHFVYEIKEVKKKQA